ncbi:MAG: quinolinate synthase NadA [Candidatus Aminicenantes bacterium]|nr:quinolinate synthase NadA [Candidatus Aminicenantes bacterium]
MDDLTIQIKKLLVEKDAVLLAHNYQVSEVQLIADHLGDSLELSRLAADVKNSVIVFAGVKFMAETAKILSPEKKVLLPRLDAGCPMADMLTADELRYLKEQHPKAKVVTYVNSGADIKAESDACCTSSNAAKIVANIDTDEIIFVPDRNLGSYVQSIVPDKKIILFEGYCYVHNRIKKDEIIEMKKLYPNAKIIVHPEVRSEIIELADEVLSTSGILRYASASPAGEFIVATEEGLLDRMRRENPGKKFYPALRPKVCQNMKRTTLKDIYLSLVHDRYEIEIDEEISKKALRSLNEMLKYV